MHSLRKVLVVIIPLILAVTLATAASAESGPFSLVLLATTDVHGHIYPTDYFTGQYDSGGLAQIKTVVNEIRSQEPNVILIDNGDAIRGGNTTLPVYYQSLKDLPHPMAVAMNDMKYDALALGNHEFNYGLEVLNNFRQSAAFPLISANVLDRDGNPVFQPYRIKDFGPVQIGVIGITIPAEQAWEKPENIPGLTFADPVIQTGKYIEELKGKGVDVIVVAEHTGWEYLPRDPKDAEGYLWPEDWVPTHLDEENFTLRLAEIPGIDVIIAGHSHAVVPVCDSRSKRFDTPVVVTQPGSWGDFLSRVDLTLEETDEGWRVTQSKADVISMEQVEPDQALLELTRVYHDAAEAHYTTPIGTATEALSSNWRTRFFDRNLPRLINEVQLQASGADISFAYVPTADAVIPAGPITVRQIYTFYSNGASVYKVQVTGAVVRAALEQAARYFNQFTSRETRPEQLINPNRHSDNWDVCAGVQYTIDISRPAGHRVIEMKFRGQDVTDEMALTAAITNYQAKGSGGYAMFRNCKVLWSSGRELRDLMVDYIKSRGTIDPLLYPDEYRLLPRDIFERFPSLSLEP